jgi:hypothetical protein
LSGKGVRSRPHPIPECPIGDKLNQLFGGQKKPELLKRGVVLDIAEGGFVGANNVGAQALALAFFAKIFFIQEVAAFAEGLHNQFAVFHLGGEKISLFVRRRGGIVVGHFDFSLYI